MDGCSKMGVTAIDGVRRNMAFNDIRSGARTLIDTKDARNIAGHSADCGANWSSVSFAVLGAWVAPPGMPCALAEMLRVATTQAAVANRKTIRLY